METRRHLVCWKHKQQASDQTRADVMAPPALPPCGLLIIAFTTTEAEVNRRHLLCRKEISEKHRIRNGESRLWPCTEAGRK
ncbi:hypothetical protein PoB_004719300 [Plakobranchus ocellatus]|uniref:Uncharacterized protein n=1 Tax=Plakobranchus ocellatus TaxID=259542 RepID=A0AAV4BNI5_9GAST|nr:hypothetical protein PoB_004719300 [Plakobranchus ocellatus]